MLSWNDYVVSLVLLAEEEETPTLSGSLVLRGRKTLYLLYGQLVRRLFQLAPQTPSLFGP